MVTGLKSMTLSEIALACGGKLINCEGTTVISNISIDSRKIKAGFLYIPIIGERFDGHDFIASALENGAVCTLTQKPDNNGSYPQIAVESTFSALKQIAEYYRSLFSIPVIEISGSSGKTSTKEMIYSVLSEQLRVLKTEGNLNNEIGVPQTIFNIDEEHQAAVIETGINHFGEMTNLARMVKPDIAVITNIGTAHLEFLGSRDGILKAKTEMLEFLKPDGIAVLNGDDDKLVTVKGVKTCFYGLNSSNDYYAENIITRGIDGTEFTIVHGTHKVQAFVPALGNHMIMNAVAAFAIADYLNIPEEKIINGIKKFKNIDGRFNVIKTSSLTLINDCYNANPDSLNASLKVMKNLSGRRAAVLADMKELGETSAELHTSAGKFAAECLDVIICIGKDAKYIKTGAETANAEIKAFYFETNEAAKTALKDILTVSDTVLIKGSHSMKLSEITDYLKTLNL